MTLILILLQNKPSRARGDGMEHFEWVEREQGITLNEFQRKAVNLLCTSQGCGAYDLRCWKKAEWNYGAAGVRFVLYTPRLATIDHDGLTMLVIGAHEQMIRVQISPVSFNYIAICMWQRKREGSISTRHPTIEQAVVDYRKMFAKTKGGE